MNTKTQELVTAGYALAKGLDAESAKLVKELATELAVQRVRADELNKRAVSLAVENAGLKGCIVNHTRAVENWNSWADPEDKIPNNSETPATDAAIANIQAQGVEKFAQHPALGIIACGHIALEFAAQLRKEAGIEQ